MYDLRRVQPEGIGTVARATPVPIRVIIKKVKVATRERFLLLAEKVSTGIARELEVLMSHGKAHRNAFKTL